MYYHVVYANTSLSGGYVPDSQITNQISVINQAYAGTGLSFTLTQIRVSSFISEETEGADMICVVHYQIDALSAHSTLHGSTQLAPATVLKPR